MKSSSRGDAVFVVARSRPALLLQNLSLARRLYFRYNARSRLLRAGTETSASGAGTRILCPSWARGLGLFVALQPALERALLPVYYSSRRGSLC